jgi:diaminopimelate decarboxylase
MEYAKACRNGVPGGHIVFNGPSKSEAELRMAFEDGARVHLDHYDELALAERVARSLGRTVDVGIRLNLSGGSTPRWGRFGFALENGQAWDAVRRLQGGGALRLNALHAHMGTFVLDGEAYAEAAQKLATFVNRLRSELGIRLESIDLGGGFASPARLKAQYLPSAQTVPSFAQYAEAIASGLSALDTRPE